MIMDNVAAPKQGEKVRELIEGRGWELSHFPPYSPGPNPIGRRRSRR